MNLTLGMDTSCGNTVLGLAEGGRPIFEGQYDLGRTQAAQLPRLVRQILQTFQRPLESLETLAVTVGPGAYTGVRIGVAYGTALADALGIRVVPLCTLEVLAEEIPFPDTTVASFLKARKGHLYGALYRREDKCLSILTPPRFVSEQEFLETLKDLPPGFLVGPHLEDETFARNFSWRHLRRTCPRGSLLALRGEEAAPRALNPSEVRIDYLREPDFGPKGCF